MSLNPVAKKWVRALRSGKYRRTTGKLRRDGKYCCLGVLTDLAVKAGVIKTFRGQHSGDPEYADTALCKAVLKWAGLSEEEGGYGYGSSLALRNDSGASFVAIAKIIESEPEGLFKK